jgi:hypothetical protein
VRIRLDHDPVGTVRDPAGVLRRGAAREARGRQVEAAPVEADRARLADETRPELLEQPIGADERSPEQLDVSRFVQGLDLVLLERDGLGHLDRAWPDPDVDAAVSQPRHQLPVEGGHGSGSKVHDECLRPSVGHDEAMVDEVEGDLKGAVSVRDRWRREAPGGDLERDVPPVVHRRRERQADLADDLGPHVQGGDRRLPLPPRQLGPSFSPGGRSSRSRGSAEAAAGSRLRVRIRRAGRQCNREVQSGGTRPAGPGTGWSSGW